MELNIQPGLKGQAHLTVAESHTAAHVGSGTVQVLATPIMIALMEAAAMDAVSRLLPPGVQTVGTHVDVRHSAPTPVGMRVTAQAELIAVQGRTLTFRVMAADEREQVGEGTHQRTIVNVQRFHERIRAKAVS